MENQTDDTQIETLVNALRILLGVLRDPTSNGKIELNAEARNKARDEAHDTAQSILDAIEALDDVSHGMMAALNINKHAKDTQTQ